ncbi:MULTISPECIES: DapH/DapD/GlmU-related protein [unclassified Adlercreutzia]|uniref:acyltransferase n=1 Tax=unclassified Adlercreutzia TaxID=2636013 RepID=UPI0013EDC3D9|nr:MULTISPECIES: acyltransferase [unclassified Adlercreutzia]
MTDSVDAVKPGKQGCRKYVKYPLKVVLLLIDKVSRSTYKKLYPKYLKWLGVDVSDSFADFGDPWISPSCIFDASAYHLIKLGDGVTVSYDVSLLVHDWSIDKPLCLEGRHGCLLGPIEIGQNSFIGARSVVLPNTRIGKNCIVGANAVVKGTFPDGSVIGGNPAKIIGQTDAFCVKHKVKRDIFYTDESTFA